MNLFKKAGIGNNFFKKVENAGNNMFKKTSHFVNNIPNAINSVANNVKSIADDIQKKTAKYAPVASTIASMLGRPDIGLGITAGANAINNIAGKVHNSASKGQQNLQDVQNMLAQ